MFTLKKLVDIGVVAKKIGLGIAAVPFLASYKSRIQPCQITCLHTHPHAPRYFSSSLASNFFTSASFASSKFPPTSATASPWPPSPARIAKSRDLWSIRFRIESSTVSAAFSPPSLSSSASRNLSLPNHWPTSFRDGLKRHASLANQFSHLASCLYKALKEAQSKHFVATPLHLQPLASVVELLEHFCNCSAELTQYVVSKPPTKDDQNAWEDWRQLRIKVEKSAQKLATFLPKDWRSWKEKTGVPRNTIPLESLLELCIQCLLDAYPNRAKSGAKMEIGQVQALIRKSFPLPDPIPNPLLIPRKHLTNQRDTSRKKWLASPRVIFLSSSTYGGYHIGGNGQCSLAPTMRLAFRKKRELVLTRIAESELLINARCDLTKDLQNIKSGNLSEIDRVSFDNISRSPLFHQRPGQAMLTESWRDKAQCAKCRHTYGFAERNSNFDALVYPVFSCGEDVFALKLLDANLDEAE